MPLWGVAVFEPNFRASTGHGRHYQLAAGDFSDDRVQRDIDQGTEALLALGIGAPKRVFLIGASFGGYITLNGLIQRPELYRAGIALVPPSDFAWTLNWAATRSDVRLSGVPIAAALPAFGIERGSDAFERLAARSPRALAATISRPLLIMAGGRDQRVPVRSVIDFVARLPPGHDHSLYLDPEAGHGLDSDTNREALLYLTEQFLHRTIGTPAPAALAPALARKIGSQLRRRGASLR